MNRERVQGYVLSLPERLVRSVTGLAAGAARELGEVILPARVRRSRLYDSIVGSTLRFLIEQVGQIEGGSATEAAPLPSDFLARRAAGNVVEIAGIAAFHASPVWVFAALADLAGAGRELIGEIAEALQEEGLLERGGSFDNVNELLEGLENTAGRLAETVNTPPFDVAALREDWRKVSSEASRIPRAALPDVQRLAAEWSALKSEAASQGRSVVELSSVMAIGAVRSLPENARWLSRAARTGGWRTGEVLARGLLDHYRDALAEIHTTGYFEYWRREFAPYLRGAIGQFSTERVSLTERLLKRTRG